MLSTPLILLCIRSHKAAFVGGDPDKTLERQCVSHHIDLPIVHFFFVADNVTTPSAMLHRQYAEQRSLGHQDAEPELAYMIVEGDGRGY